MEKGDFSIDSVDRLGPASPQFPVILSVPHAGRYYPESLMRQTRLGEPELRALEDRYVDSLVEPLARQGFTVVIARVARACIDLNRSEREIDPEMVRPRPAHAAVEHSAKLRGGLGLVPRRLARHGNIYRGPISDTDLANRIAAVYRPFHAAVSDSLAEASRRFGTALLLDCHSMPRLAARNGFPPPDFVIGDLHGRSAAPAFASCAAQSLETGGFRTARNKPYAGGHILGRHGKPERSVHALQLEICRSLYLDREGDRPGGRFEQVASRIESVAQALVEEALSPPEALAAE